MATLQTGGFTQPRIQLQPGLVDPRILALDLSAIGRGAGQGLQLVDNFSQMRDRAIARQQEAEFRPLENLNRRLQLEAGPQLLRNRLQTSQIANARALATPIELDDESFQTIEVPRVDPVDGRTYATPDVMLQSTRTVIDPATGERRQVTRVTKPITTIEQQLLADDLSNQRAENLRLAQERIDTSAATAAAVDARSREAAADRDARARERIEIDRQLADLRGKVEDRTARQGAARLTDADRAQALRELNALSRDKTLNDYELGTRDATGNILQEDVPGMFNFGQQSVTLDKAQEDRITRRKQLQAMLEGTTADLLTPPAPATDVPRVFFPSAAGSAPSAMDTPAVDYAPVGASTTAATGPAITTPPPIVVPPPATPTAPNAPASSAQIPTLSRQQAMGLPSGSFFYGTDGILYRKP